jgi:hypothetical protein
MAHKVSMKVDHLLDLGSVDVEFEVRTGRTLLGRIQINKGGIDWTKAGARRPVKTSWQEFSEWMALKNHGTHSH